VNSEMKFLSPLTSPPRPRPLRRNLQFSTQMSW